MTTIEDKMSINQAVMKQYGALSKEITTLRKLYATEKALEKCLQVLKDKHSTKPGIKYLISDVELIRALYLPSMQSRR